MAVAVQMNGIQAPSEELSQSCDDDLMNAYTTASDGTTESRSERCNSSGTCNSILDQDNCEPRKKDAPGKIILARPRTAGARGKFFRSTTLVGSQRAADPAPPRPGGLQTAELTSVKAPADMSFFAEDWKEPPSPALTSPSVFSLASSFAATPLLMGPSSPLSSSPNSPLLPQPNSLLPTTIPTSTTTTTATATTSTASTTTTTTTAPAPALAVPPAIPTPAATASSPSTSQIPRPTSAVAARRNLPPVMPVDVTMSMPVVAIVGPDATPGESEDAAKGNQLLQGRPQPQQLSSLTTSPRPSQPHMISQNIEPPEPLSPSLLKPSLPSSAIAIATATATAASSASSPIATAASLPGMTLNISAPPTSLLPPKGQQQMGEVRSDDSTDRQPPARALVPRSAPSSPGLPAKPFDEAPAAPNTSPSSSETPVRRSRHTKLLSQVAVQSARQRTAPIAGEGESPRRSRKPKGTWGAFNQEERVHNYPQQPDQLPDLGPLRSEPIVRAERLRCTQDKEADMVDFKSAPSAAKEPKRRPKTASSFASEPIGPQMWSSSKDGDASNSESASPRRKHKDSGLASGMQREARWLELEEATSPVPSSRARYKLEEAQKIAGDLSRPSVPRRAHTLAQRHRPTRTAGEDFEIFTEIDGRPVTKSEHEMWASTFRRLQRDGELHHSSLPLALQQCGIDYLNPSREVEKSSESASSQGPPGLEYATLSLDEFLRYVCDYLHNSEKHFREIYNSLNDGEPIHKSQMPMLFAQLNGRLRSHTLDEVCTDVSSVCRGSPIGYFTFEDSIRVVELYKSRQGFRKLELDQFQLAIKVFDRKGSGDIPLSELPSALLWLGLSLPEVELRTMIDEVVGSEASKLGHQQFLLLLRKALEREMSLVEQKLGPLTTRGSLSGFFIESLLKELGCHAPAVAVLEAMQDLNLGGIGAEEALEQLREQPDRFQGTFALKGFCFQMTAEEVCDLLMKIRSREGFTRSEWQDLRSLYDRFAGDSDGRVNVQGMGKALRWLGYNFCLNQRRHFMAEVDAEGGSCITVGFRSFVKVVKCAQSTFKDRILEVFESYAGDCSTSAHITKRDAFAALQDLDCLHSSTMPSQDLPSKLSLSTFRGMALSAREDLRSYYHTHFEYGPAMVQRVKECFQRCPSREDDTISHKDTASIVQHLYPNYAQSVEWRSNLVSLIDSILEDSGRRISFKRVLQLVREIEDSEEGSRLTEELDVIEEVEASPTDVRDVRSLFLEMLKRVGRKDLQKLPLAPVKAMMRNCLQHGPRKQHIVDGFVDQAIREAGVRGAQFVEQIQTSDYAEPQLAVDFPLFLRIMRKVDESSAVSASQHGRHSMHSTDD